MADPHAGQPVLTEGAPLDDARVAVVLLHGRGSSAEQILALTRALPSERVAYLAPQAAGNAWYPQRFIAPILQNEPWLSSALGVIARLIEQASVHGLARERVVLGGFSQGACLAAESALRLGGRFGGLFALAGGIIGPPGGLRVHDRKLDGTPAFVGCGDVDSHIPLESVHETIRVLTAQGAQVTQRIYRGVGHVLVSDQLDRTRALIEKALAES